MIYTVENGFILAAISEIDDNYSISNFYSNQNHYYNNSYYGNNNRSIHNGFC